MKNQVSAAVLIIIVLLGVSANSAVYAQQDHNATSSTDEFRCSSTSKYQSKFNSRDTNAVVDLNSPNLQSVNSSLLVNNNCLNGVVVYQTSLITNQPVPVCVTSEMMNSQLLSAWGQLFNIDFTIKSDNDSNNNNNNNNNNNDDDDRNDKNHRDNYHNGNTPDGDCLFNPSLPKCAPDNGECPKGFNQNEDGNCFPAHPEGCPNGYHGVDDDETGKCIDDNEGCPNGMVFRSDGKTCGHEDDLCPDDNNPNCETETDPDPDTEGDVLNCSDFSGNNIQVGSNDPNNLDGDNDGAGCDKDQDKEVASEPIPVSVSSIETSIPIVTLAQLPTDPVIQDSRY